MLAWGVVKVAAVAAVGVPFLVLLLAVLTKATGNGSFTGVWLGFFALIGFLHSRSARSCGRCCSVALPFLRRARRVA